MINDYYFEGGLKMIDLISFNKSLKNILDPKVLGFYQQRKVERFFLIWHYKTTAVKNVFTGNLNIKDAITSIKVSDAFLEELLKLWAEVNFEQKITTLG